MRLTFVREARIHLIPCELSGLTRDKVITPLCLHDLFQSISKLVWNVMGRRYRAKEIFNFVMLISRSNLFTQKHPKW